MKRWTGSFFEKISLKSLGLRIQLGHLDSCCPNPDPAFNDDFVVIAPNGVHSVGLNYCGCGGAASATAQLLQARLFPSTVANPKTAATFSVCQAFQMLSFMSKISGFEFYRSLVRLTENIGVSPPPVSTGCIYINIFAN